MTLEAAEPVSPAGRRLLTGRRNELYIINSVFSSSLAAFWLPGVPPYSAAGCTSLRISCCTSRRLRQMGRGDSRRLRPAATIHMEREKTAASVRKAREGSALRSAVSDTEILQSSAQSRSRSASAGGRAATSAWWVKLEMVPSTGKFELLRNIGSVVASLIRRSLPILGFNYSLALAVVLLPECPPIAPLSP